MNSARLVIFSLAMFSMLPIRADGWEDFWLRYHDRTSTESSATTSSANAPPTIVGNPATAVTVGQAYLFTPTTSDPDGDTLRFHVSNLPEWADFNRRTGTLRGIPGSADIGIYDDIVITVTDGLTRVRLDPLSIMVTAASNSTKSAELSWSMPSSRTDGSPLALSEIGGYRIYMGKSRDNLALLIDLQNSSTTRYRLSNLAPGTYHFAVTVYDLNGNESPFSNIADKQLF